MDISLYARLGVWLLFGVLGLDLSSNNVLADVVSLLEVEEFPDLGRALGAETLGKDVVGKAGVFLLTLLDDSEGKDGNVVADDASTNGLPATLTRATGSVARVSVGEEQAGTDREEDTLLHRETLLVVTTSDTEDVSSPFRTKDVAFNLLGEALVVECAADEQ